MAAPRRQGVSIFLRILIAFLAVNMVTSVVLIALAYGFTRDSVEKRTKENIRQQLAMLRDTFEHEYRTDLKRLIQGIVSASALDDYLQASRVEQRIASKQLEKIFRQVLADHPSYQSISFVDAEGEIVVEVVGKRRTRDPVNLRQLAAAGTDPGRPARRAEAELFTALANIPVLLSSGNMEWFMPPREVQIAGPYVDAAGLVSFTAAIAKVDLDIGEFGGVVMVRQRLAGFLDDLREVHMFGENPIWVLDPEGRDLQRPSNAAATFDPRDHDLSPGFEAGLQIRDVDAGIVAYQDFAVTAGQPLVRIAVGIPAMLLLQDFTPAVRFFSAVLVGSIGVVLMLALYVSSYLSRPIVELAATAARLAAGDLGARVRLRTTGEVQVLVDSFNRMTDQLQETIAARDQSLTSVVTEVAERKRAEAELLRQAEELTRARVAAEAASQAKSRFLANMSHEIRTPINGVLGMAELLVNSGLRDKQARFAGLILNSAQSLLGTINDILDFSKIEAEQLELDETPFDLRGLVEDVSHEFAVMAHRRGIEMLCHVPDDVPRAVHGDPTRLRQVLVNLIGNALKFTEHGEVVVELARTSAVDEPGEPTPVRFEVRDSGIGISPEAQARIFDSFTQADGSTSRMYGGTGLGLAICRKLIELMGGELKVASTPGRGATFWFTVPLRADPKAYPGGPAEAALAGLRVLVVDDNATNREILERQLTGWGAANASVADGEEALRALRAAHGAGKAYDVALVDRHMARVDGLDLARAVRADAALAPTQLVLLSSMSLDLDGDQGRALGFAAQLTRPVRAADLLTCLTSLARHEPAPDLVADPAPGGHERVPDFGALVLVAEDNPVNQEVVTEMLKALGCATVLAEHGQEAIAAVARRPVDLVLMDCQMPGMDGFEATAAIRQHEAADGVIRPLPIIALTANAMEGDRDRCLAAGMNDYLSKPFRQSELAALLGRWLPAGPAVDQAGAPTTDGPDQRSNQDDPMAPPIQLDQAALDALRALEDRGAVGLIDRAIDKFVGYLEEVLATMVASAGSGDAEGLARAAHSLKSSAASLGAADLAALCRELEAATRSGTLPDEVETRLAALHEVAAGTVAALAAERRAAPAA